MSEKDKYYIERCLNGHADDFRYLVKRYQGPLLGHIAGKSANLDLAEEAAQETLVRAYFKLGHLKKRESFFSWLLGIANNVVKENQRHQLRQRQEKLIRSESADKSRVEISHDHGLEKAIGKLPDNYRKVVLLRYYGGHSCGEVAEQLEMPLGTVTKTLSRAYALLREELKRRRQSDSEVQK